MTVQVTAQLKQDLARDGAAVVRGLFSPAQLGRLRECFDYAVTHPSPMAGKVFEGTADEHFNEYGNPDNLDAYLSVIKELELADFVASLWDSEHVWFLGEELFIKSGARRAARPGTRTRPTCRPTVRTW